MRIILCFILLTTVYSCRGTQGRGTQDLDYPTFVREQYLYDTTKNKSLDVIYKQGVSKLPTVVYIHGGAWCKDNKSEWSDNAGRYLLDRGIISVSIDYTLAPEPLYTQDTTKGVYPDIIDDVTNALQWVCKNIHNFGGDPDQIFIMGFSAGNLLADLVVLQNRIPDMQNCIKGIINLDAGPYITMDKKLMEQQGIIPFWKNTFGVTNYNNNILNPAQLISQHNWLPPFLLIYQDIDIRLIPNQELAQILRANKHICHEVIINGVAHDNFPRFVELNLPFSTEIVNFVENYSEKNDPQKK